MNGGNGGDEFAHVARILTARFGVDCTDRFGCWLWTGPLQHGVVAFTVDGQRVMGTRFVWSLARGLPNPRRHLWHSCDGGVSRNPARCLNPRHLLPYHPAARRASLRPLTLRTERPRRKLSASAVRALRELYARGGMRPSDLAQRYHVSEATVQRAVAAA